jgi:rhamnulokinase
LEQITTVANRQVSVIHIVGGGSQNELLNQMTANATGLPVITGPVEATVLGNALVQLITQGEMSDLAQARQIVAGMDELKRYEPEETSVWNEAYTRYQETTRRELKTV